MNNSNESILRIVDRRLDEALLQHSLNELHSAIILGHKLLVIRHLTDKLENEIVNIPVTDLKIRNGNWLYRLADVIASNFFITSDLVYKKNYNDRQCVQVHFLGNKDDVDLATQIFYLALDSYDKLFKFMIKQKREQAKVENEIWTRNMTTGFKCEIQDSCISSLSNYMGIQYNEILYSAYLEGQKETAEQTRERERNTQMYFSGSIE